MSEPRVLTEAEVERLRRLGCILYPKEDVFNVLSTLRAAWAERDAARRWARSWKERAWIERRAVRRLERMAQAWMADCQTYRAEVERLREVVEAARPIKERNLSDYDLLVVCRQIRAALAHLDEEPTQGRDPS